MITIPATLLRRRKGKVYSVCQAKMVPVGITGGFWAVVSSTWLNCIWTGSLRYNNWLLAQFKQHYPGDELVFSPGDQVWRSWVGDTGHYKNYGRLYPMLETLPNVQPFEELVKRPRERSLPTNWVRLELANLAREAIIDGTHHASR